MAVDAAKKSATYLNALKAIGAIMPPEDAILATSCVLCSLVARCGRGRQDERVLEDSPHRGASPTYQLHVMLVFFRTSLWYVRNEL